MEQLLYNDCCETLAADNMRGVRGWPMMTFEMMTFAA